MQRSFLPAILLLAFSAAATITANESPGKAAIGNTVNPVESTLQMVIKAINELVEWVSMNFPTYFWVFFTYFLMSWHFPLTFSQQFPSIFSLQSTIVHFQWGATLSQSTKSSKWNTTTPTRYRRLYWQAREVLRSAAFVARKNTIDGAQHVQIVCVLQAGNQSNAMLVQIYTHWISRNHGPITGGWIWTIRPQCFSDIPTDNR